MIQQLPQQTNKSMGLDTAIYYLPKIPMFSVLCKILTQNTVKSSLCDFTPVRDNKLYNQRKCDFLQESIITISRQSLQKLNIFYIFYILMMLKTYLVKLRSLLTFIQKSRSFKIPLGSKLCRHEQFYPRNILQHILLFPGQE